MTDDDAKPYKQRRFYRVGLSDAEIRRDYLQFARAAKTFLDAFDSGMLVTAFETLPPARTKLHKAMLSEIGEIETYCEKRAAYFKNREQRKNRRQLLIEGLIEAWKLAGSKVIAGNHGSGSSLVKFLSLITRQVMDAPLSTDALRALVKDYNRHH